MLLKSGKHCDLNKKNINKKVTCKKKASSKQDTMPHSTRSKRRLSEEKDSDQPYKKQCHEDDQDLLMIAEYSKPIDVHQASVTTTCNYPDTVFGLSRLSFSFKNILYTYLLRMTNFQVKRFIY
jgi:hypothetical protein